MKNLLLVGAGGFGRCVYWQCSTDADHNRLWQLKGFLDDRAGILDAFSCPHAVIGDPSLYAPIPGDVFLCALGDPAARQKYAAPLLAKGAEFMSLCSDVTMPRSVRHGFGCIFEPRTAVGSDSLVGNFVVALTMSIIGHDVTVGDYVQIGSFAFIGAHASIGEGAVIHPHSCVLPGVTVGRGATIGAGSIVTKNVPDKATVFGNPAKAIFFS